MKWTKHGLFFELKENDSADWRQSHTQLPVIDNNLGERWRIYYSSRDKQGRSLPCWLEVEAGNPNNILQQNTGPILQLGGANEFDEHGVMPTAVMHRQNKIYLYYIGWSRQSDVPYRNSIGLAISEDQGKTFEKFSHNPLFPANSVDPVFTGTLNVIEEFNRYHGYYMSCSEWRVCDGRLEPRYHLRYASSEDGIKWNRSGQVVIDYANNNEGGIVAAAVIRQQDSFHMWYSYRKDRDFRTNRENSYRIGYARSEDAFNWVRMDDNVGLDRAASGWESEMQAYPAVVKHQNRIFMFYNGNGFGQSGIGYASLELNQLK